MSFQLDKAVVNLCVSDEFAVLKQGLQDRCFDPHSPNNSDMFDHFKLAGADDHFYLFPSSLAMIKTKESVNMSANATGIIHVSSAYARCGLIVNTTPVEAGFRGNLTLALVNTTPLPIKIYLHELIAQMYLSAGEECDVTYADRKGKYQDQDDVTFSKV